MNDLDWIKSVVNNLDTSKISSDTLDSLIRVLAKKRGEVVDRENILFNEKKIEEDKANLAAVATVASAGALGLYYLSYILI